MPKKQKRSGPKTTGTSPKAAALAVKRRQALDLRLAGFNLQTIAERLNYADPSGARKAILGALHDMMPDLTADVKPLELARLDSLLASTWLQAKQGNLPAVDRVVKMMERRAKLLGLDAPAWVELSGPQGAPISVKEVIIASAREATKD